MDTMDPVQLYYFFQKPTFPVRVLLRDGRSYNIATREFVMAGCVSSLFCKAQVR